MDEENLFGEQQQNFAGDGFGNENEREYSASEGDEQEYSESGNGTDEEGHTEAGDGEQSYLVGDNNSYGQQYLESDGTDYDFSTDTQYGEQGAFIGNAALGFPNSDIWDNINFPSDQQPETDFESADNYGYSQQQDAYGFNPFDEEQNTGFASFSSSYNQYEDADGESALSGEESYGSLREQEIGNYGQVDNDSNDTGFDLPDNSWDEWNVSQGEQSLPVDPALLVAAGEQGYYSNGFEYGLDNGFENFNLQIVNQDKVRTGEVSYPTAADNRAGIAEGCDGMPSGVSNFVTASSETYTGLPEKADTQNGSTPTLLAGNDTGVGNKLSTKAGDLGGPISKPTTPANTGTSNPEVDGGYTDIKTKINKDGAHVNVDTCQSHPGGKTTVSISAGVDKDGSPEFSGGVFNSWGGARTDKSNCEQ